MLFANIAALVAKGVTVQFTITGASEGKLEVSLIPTVEAGTTLNLVPKSFVGTPQELDAEFGEVIAGYATVNLSLKQQLEDVATVAEAAAKEAAEEAAKKAAKKSATRDAGNSKAATKSPTLIEAGDGEDDLDEAGDGQPASGRDPVQAQPLATTGQAQTLPLEL
ncbi:MAG: PRTRC system protein E [Burkholderiaceae bacterium]|nr:PRTRC system protein E [Burkholderiaceae bacterium]MDP3139189.1 PRTRC system protein E [Burkholderiaceae bacterium]